MDKQFSDSIADQINKATEAAVEQTIEKILSDTAWLTKLENTIAQRVVDKVSNKISAIDVNLAIKDTIMENKHQILGEFANNFSSKGISDTADSLELTIMSDAVVAENELHCNDFTVERNTQLKGDLTVDGDLAIKGRVNVDNQSWQELAGYIEDNTFARVKENFEQSVSDTVFDRAKKGISFDNVIVNGEHLLQDNSLATSIKHSHLTRVGTLENLSVTGRLGINTNHPTDALCVWDEEVSVCVGKLSANTGYIGTAKNQDLVIGTNKQRQIQLSKDGGVWVEKLTVGKNNIGHERSVPNYSGTKGDIVFNIDHKTGDPFAWICLGNYRWQELRSA